MKIEMFGMQIYHLATPSIVCRGATVAHSDEKINDKQKDPGFLLIK
jgi:hypothetical protein